jgi:hypothetical protein
MKIQVAKAAHPKNATNEESRLCVLHEGGMTGMARACAEASPCPAPVLVDDPLPTQGSGRREARPAALRDRPEPQGC